MKAVDGTTITIERLDEAERKIENYKKIKEDNIFDSFYRSDLAVFETGIALMRSELKKESFGM